MNYKNVEIMELCPLVFVSQEDLDRASIKGLEDKGRLIPFFKANRVVDVFLRKNHINAYADCNIDNMVEVRGIDDPFDVMQVFNLCKQHFQKVEIGVFLEDYITEDGQDVNFIELDSEDQFWPEFTLSENEIKNNPAEPKTVSTTTSDQMVVGTLNAEESVELLARWNAWHKDRK